MATSTMVNRSYLCGRQISSMRKNPSIAQRITSAIFGAPDILRAYGSYDRQTSIFQPKKSATKEPICKGLVHFIYSLDVNEKGRHGLLPKIWITEPTSKEDGSRSRKLVASYPNGPDADGSKALELAERMMGEAFNASESYRKEDIVQLFQAAEILLMHSSAKKNKDAYMELAKIYRFDLCKGAYYQTIAEAKAQHARPLDQNSLLKRAWMLYSICAKSGDPKAYCALGDILLRDATSDEESIRAVGYYKRAWNIVLDRAMREVGRCFSSETPCRDVIDALQSSTVSELGSCALRMAQCAEKGIGTQRALFEARDLYSLSKRCLGRSFSLGCWHNKKELHESKMGFKRIVQELTLENDRLKKSA